MTAWFADERPTEERREFIFYSDDELQSYRYRSSNWMRHMKAILFSLLAAIPTLAAADEPNDPLGASLTPRIEQINSEITGLKQHAWTGEYSAGDGFYSVTLWIAADAGAVFQSSGCMHHDRCEGDIVSREGSIEIDWDGHDVNDPFVAGRVYAPVHWGRTTLIVPIGRLHSFCIAARKNATAPISWSFDILRQSSLHWDAVVAWCQTTQPILTRRMDRGQLSTTMLLAAYHPVGQRQPLNSRAETLNCTACLSQCATDTKCTSQCAPLHSRTEESILP